MRYKFEEFFREGPLPPAPAAGIAQAAIRASVTAGELYEAESSRWTNFQERIAERLQVAKDIIETCSTGVRPSSDDVYQLKIGSGCAGYSPEIKSDATPCYIRNELGELRRVSQTAILALAELAGSDAERLVNQIPRGNSIEWAKLSRKCEGTPVERHGETRAGSERAEVVGKPAKGNRGRRKGSAASDVKQDQRIADAWAKGFGLYASQENLATVFGIGKADVVAALDRHRKRKSETIRAGKHRQDQ